METYLLLVPYDPNDGISPDENLSRFLADKLRNREPMSDAELAFAAHTIDGRMIAIPAKRKKGEKLSHHHRSLALDSYGIRNIEIAREYEAMLQPGNSDAVIRELSDKYCIGYHAIYPALRHGRELLSKMSETGMHLYKLGLE